MTTKVTEQQINEAIKEVTYTVLPDKRTTVCQITLKNGFTVSGQSSCVSQANFNKEYGELYAYKNAYAECWKFLGYELKSKVTMIEEAGDPSGLILKVGVPTTYVGTKVVRALPMNRLAYNNLRGWDLPRDEDGTDEGYLVEYVDGGQANVQGFTGYISWSPKAVFEQSYVLGIKAHPSTIKDRLIVERDQTAERLKKLSLFLGSGNQPKLSTFDWNDLKQQEKIMQDYVAVLERRIKRTA